MRSLAIDLLRMLGAQGPRSVPALAAACDARVAEVGHCLARLEGTRLVAIADGVARLAAPFDFLDPARIAAGLGGRATSLRIDVIDACASTSSALLAAADATAGSRLLIAEEQLAGRGRRGRRWLSCVGAALTLSLQRASRRAPRELAALPLAAG